jgi:hypothetical protein
MRALVGAVLTIVVCTTTALGADDNACAVAAHLVHADAGLPRVAKAIAKTHDLTVVVSGTASSSLPGAEGVKLAYPARLELALRKKLPDVTVKVVTDVTARRAASDMAQNFLGILKKERPSLVVWQTGTFDSMRGVPLEEFQSTLERGVETLHGGGADVIMMNMQYSPRTDAVLASQAYAEAIRWVALETNLNVFDRQGIMRHWSELGTFDLAAATKSLDTAARVHDCIGSLLADLVADAIKLIETEPKETK